MIGESLHGADRSRSIAEARAWRIRNKPKFDALYGSEDDHRFIETERARGLEFARQWRARWRGRANA